MECSCNGMVDTCAITSGCSEDKHDADASASVSHDIVDLVAKNRNVSIFLFFYPLFFSEGALRTLLMISISFSCTCITWFCDMNCGKCYFCRKASEIFTLHIRWSCWFSNPGISKVAIFVMEMTFNLGNCCYGNLEMESPKFPYEINEIWKVKWYAYEV